jgi:hypothetical protein
MYDADSPDADQKCCE